MNTFRNQYLASFCANLGALQSGILMGWCSPILLILLSQDSPLSTGTITIDEASLVMSIYCLGGAVSTIIFGFLVNRIGRKYTIVIGAFLQTIAWSMILFGDNIDILYTARCLSGFGTAPALLAVPSFVAEISDKKIRGFLGSIFSLNMNLGIVIGYTVGAFFDYITLPLLGTIIGVIFVISMLLLPETPLFLYSQQKFKEAELSANFYNYDIKANVGIETNNSKSSRDKSESKSRGITLSDLGEKSTRKAIIITICLFILSQFSGIFVFVTYASQIFEDAGTFLHPNIAAIIIGCLQLAGSYVSTVLVDKAGRRFLMSISALGTFLALFCMGIFTYLKHIQVDVSSVGWIPVLCLSVGICISAIGLRPVPYVVAAETLPQNLRGPFFAVIGVILWVFGYVMMQYFPYAVSLIYLHGCMFFFAASCFIFLIFTLCYVPETKGKSFEEIKTILANG